MWWGVSVGGHLPHTDCGSISPPAIAHSRLHAEETPFPPLTHAAGSFLLVLVRGIYKQRGCLLAHGLAGQAEEWESGVGLGAAGVTLALAPCPIHCGVLPPAWAPSGLHRDF